MNTFIALFRGINVGGKHILPMKDLVNILEDLSCQQIKTYIQSGNVVFKTEDKDRESLAEKISKSIEKHFNFKPKVLLLEAAELEVAINNNPFPTENVKSLHFTFLEAQPESPDLNALTDLKTASEEFKLYQTTFYLYAPEGIGRSKMAVKVEKHLGVEGTARNWNTVNKLSEMVNQISL